MKRKPCGKVSLEEGIERMREDVMALHGIGRSVAHIAAVFRLTKSIVRDAISLKREEASGTVARMHASELWREPPSRLIADVVKMADENWVNFGQGVLEQ